MEALIRILVVDDDEGIRWLVRRILKERGYAVVTVSDGEAALRVAGSGIADPREVIHLVLTDIDMPGRDGQELGCQLAMLCPILPVIYMSGTTYGLARRTLVSDEDHFIEKPFPPNALLRKVDLVLRLGAQARAAAAELNSQDSDQRL